MTISFLFSLILNWFQQVHFHDFVPNLTRRGFRCKTISPYGRKEIIDYWQIFNYNKRAIDFVRTKSPLFRPNAVGRRDLPCVSL